MELNDKIVIYRSEDGETQLEVRINQDTVWLNAYQIAELFGRDSKTIRKHIANAIKEELAGEVGWLSGQIKKGCGLSPLG